MDKENKAKLITCDACDWQGTSDQNHEKGGPECEENLQDLLKKELEYLDPLRDPRYKGDVLFPSRLLRQK